MNDMVDMSRFIEAKSDQLNADDLIGAPRTITVTRVTGNDGDQPVSIFYQGDNGKPFKPCKTIRRVLMGVWGRYANEYVGKSMTIFRDDKVTFGGLETGGIRISHMSGIDKETTVVVMKSKGKKAGMKILPLVIERAETNATFTIDQARSDLEFAADLDELKAIWSRKIMAPFRDELQTVLNDRKAAMSRNDGTLSEDNPTATEGMPDADRGESDPRVEMVARLVSDLSIAAVPDDIKAADTLYQQHRAGFADDQVAEVERALAGARAKVGGR